MVGITISSSAWYYTDLVAMEHPSWLSLPGRICQDLGELELVKCLPS